MPSQDQRRHEEQNKNIKYFSSLQLKRQNDGVDADKGKGRRTVKPKNVPSVVNVFGNVDAVYHDIPDEAAQLRTGTPKPSIPQPTWRKGENPAPTKLHHPHKGDLVHSTPEPDVDPTTQLLLAKVEGLEEKLQRYDYSILQGEWEVKNMKLQRENIRQMKKGSKVRDDALIESQKIPKSQVADRNQNTLLHDRRFPINTTLPVLSCEAGSSPTPSKQPPNHYVAHARDLRFGKKMNVQLGIKADAPYSVDPVYQKFPKKRLNEATVSHAGNMLEKFVNSTVGNYNKGMFVDGGAKKATLGLERCSAPQPNAAPVQKMQTKKSVTIAATHDVVNQ